MDEGNITGLTTSQVRLVRVVEMLYEGALERLHDCKNVDGVLACPTCREMEAVFISGMTLLGYVRGEYGDEILADAAAKLAELSQRTAGYSDAAQELSGFIRLGSSEP